MIRQLQLDTSKHRLLWSNHSVVERKEPATTDLPSSRAAGPQTAARWLLSIALRHHVLWILAPPEPITTRCQALEPSLHAGREAHPIPAGHCSPPLAQSPPGGSRLATHDAGITDCRARFANQRRHPSSAVVLSVDHRGRWRLSSGRGTARFHGQVPAKQRNGLWHHPTPRRPRAALTASELLHHSTTKKV